MLAITNPEKLIPRHDEVLLERTSPSKLPNGLYAPSTVEEPWPICRVVRLGPKVSDDLRVGMLVGIGELHFKAGEFSCCGKTYCLTRDEGVALICDEAMSDPDKEE